MTVWIPFGVHLDTVWIPCCDRLVAWMPCCGHLVTVWWQCESLIWILGSPGSVSWRLEQPSLPVGLHEGAHAPVLPPLVFGEDFDRPAVTSSIHHPLSTIQTPIILDSPSIIIEVSSTTWSSIIYHLPSITHHSPFKRPLFLIRHPISHLSLSTIPHTQYNYPLPFTIHYIIIHYSRYNHPLSFTIHHLIIHHSPSNYPPFAI